MQILIGCAKTMSGNAPEISGCTEPVFGKNADEIAMQLAGYSADELSDMLHCNKAIAAENRLRYLNFFDTATRRPAVFSYIT